MDLIGLKTEGTEDSHHGSGQDPADFELFNAVVASHTNDMVCLHSADRRVVFCTPSCFSLLGYRPEEIQGLELFDFMAKEFKMDLNEELLDRMLYRNQTDVKVKLRKKSGENIWVKTRWYQPDSVAKLGKGYAISVTTDVTESVLLLDDLINAWSKEKEINQLRSNLFAIASHEFKTPLAVAKMQIDMLHELCVKDDKGSRTNKHLDILQKQVDRLHHMVLDIVRFRKMSSGEEPFKPVVLDFLELVKNQVASLKEKYTDRIIDVHIRGEERPLQGDGRMLSYVISSLLNNALKYSPSESTVSIECDFLDPDAFFFRVKDEGIGIPEEESARIFEPFYRAGNAMNTEGTGVALSIIKEFVVYHSGEIHVNSVEGKGSVFVIRLPFSVFSQV